VAVLPAEDLEGVSNKEIMELLLLTQYFDMVKDVGAASKSSTLFMTHSPSAVNKVTHTMWWLIAQHAALLWVLEEPCRVVKW
jgi:hypothetical protein